MYAVIKTGGKQYKVTEGEIITIEKIEGDKGKEIVFDEVLMVNKGEILRIGNPYVSGAKVIGEIVAQKKGPKIYVFKMKRRKGYHKKIGHRQRLTVAKIKEISL